MNSGSSSSSCKATAVGLKMAVSSSFCGVRRCMTAEVRLENSFLRLLMATEKECPMIFCFLLFCIFICLYAQEYIYFSSYIDQQVPLLMAPPHRLRNTYKRHVIAITFASLLPDFSLLFGLAKEWPSLKAASAHFSKGLVTLKLPMDSLFRGFMELLLADEENYAIARSMWRVGVLLRERDAKALERLWELKMKLIERPTVLTMLPEGIMNALRAVERPRRRITWGTIQITKRHALSCANCKKRLKGHCYRSRCHCNSFGSLLHKGCLGEKKCFVCSSLKHVSKIASKGPSSKTIK